MSDHKSLCECRYDVPLPPVRDGEVDHILDIMRAYGRPLGPSGVLLGTAVVTRDNERRVRFVMREMERRGLLRVVHPAWRADADDIYEVIACPDQNPRCDGSDLLHGAWCAKEATMEYQFWTLDSDGRDLLVATTTVGADAGVLWDGIRQARASVEWREARNGEYRGRLVKGWDGDKKELYYPEAARA